MNANAWSLLCLIVHYVLIYSFSFIILAASDDSILVSRAVDFKIDDITLKPAGKDLRHTQREKGGLYLHIYTPHLSIVSLALPPTHKHTHTSHLIYALIFVGCRHNPIHARISSDTCTHTQALIYRPPLLVCLFLPLSLTYTHKHVHTNHTSSCRVSCDPWPS